MYLIFDTETTGLPKRWDAPITDTDNWPRCIQIAWQLHDELGNCIEHHDYLIKPEGFNIPYDAEKIHGISTELAEEQGAALNEVLEKFNVALSKTKFVVGQNLKFDLNIMGAEFVRQNVANNLQELPVLDTCTESTAQLCQIPGGRGGKFKLPKFDKSVDDRLKKKYWSNIKKRPEIVILEGWCVGAKPQSNSIINKSINVLEKYEDKHLIWRKYANEKLKKEYKKLFAMIDHFIFMKIPNFNVVYEWRLLQESKLRKKSHSSKKIMSYNEIKRFIMFYERITLQMIKDLSKSASVVMFLKKNHEIKKVLFRS